MKKFLAFTIIGGLAIAGSGFAQTAPADSSNSTSTTKPQPDSDATGMRATSGAGSDSSSSGGTGAPMSGANSFTASQAKSRIEANGYTDVAGLKKDDQSIWRGTAMKNGKSVNVAVDYKGNVVGN